MIASNFINRFTFAILPHRLVRPNISPISPAGLTAVASRTAGAAAAVASDVAT